MDRRERENQGREDRREPSREHREPSKRDVAPPIEREHETYAGVFEEEQKGSDRRGRS